MGPAIQSSWEQNKSKENLSGEREPMCENHFLWTLKVSAARHIEKNQTSAGFYLLVALLDIISEYTRPMIKRQVNIDPARMEYSQLATQIFFYDNGM